MHLRGHKTLVGVVALLTAGACAGGVLWARAFWVSRHRITIGAVEDVVLLPWKIACPARVDTGATTSALDARELKVLPGAKEVEFRLPERCGGHLVRRKLRGWRTVISSDGASERRPVVSMEIQLGARRLNTLVTLVDRSHLKFPMLLGRHTLGSRYLVDVTHTNLLTSEPAEPEPAGRP